MRTFFARRYMRRIELVGSTEKGLGIFVLLLVAAVVVAFVLQVATDRHYLFGVDEQAYEPGAPEAADTEAETARRSAGQEENPFPDPGLADWRPPSRVDRFTADNLYVKIDGRAEVYLQFHVVGLTFGVYRHEGDGERTVDVYWYDMGTPANALGMYRAEEPPDATPVAIGHAAYQVGGAVFFCKGASYVQVFPRRTDRADAQVSLTIAERLAAQIEKTTDDP
ncbi:MAG TPA: DUF6599 family protein [Phycisphaerae bacterium]|nr:DUF6599 family protein [Phycisphaerae bacterium]